MYIKGKVMKILKQAKIYEFIKKVEDLDTYRLKIKNLHALGAYEEAVYYEDKLKGLLKSQTNKKAA